MRILFEYQERFISFKKAMKAFKYINNLLLFDFEAIDGLKAAYMHFSDHDVVGDMILISNLFKTLSKLRPDLPIDYKNLTRFSEMAK
jgi:hypothetical protein